LSNELPAIDTILRTLPWIWQSDTAPPIPVAEALSEEEAEPSSAE